MGFSSSFKVTTKDVLLPYFDFSKINGETNTFVFPDSFAVIGSEDLEGPTFFASKTVVRLVVGLGRNKLYSEIPKNKTTISSNGRNLKIKIDFKTSLCYPTSVLEYVIMLQIENYNYLDAQTNFPVKDEKIVHYISRPCHTNPMCEAVFDNFHDYPSEECPVGHIGTCSPCPLGARCPGGDEVWALPGFTKDVDSTTGARCHFAMCSSRRTLSGLRESYR